ncbi:MAG: 50S ribosomal protein L29 [Gammaproteobacteria bacterium]|nr:50S ribosomal protein L29 [Gammaproteobacteria bacterium]
MKAKEIRGMSAEGRVQEINGLLQEQFNLRMQKATGQLANNSRLGKVRRDIARIRTVMNEKGVAGNE